MCCVHITQVHILFIATWLLVRIKKRTRPQTVTVNVIRIYYKSIIIIYLMTTNMGRRPDLNEHCPLFLLFTKVSSFLKKRFISLNCNTYNTIHFITKHSYRVQHNESRPHSGLTIRNNWCVKWNTVAAYLGAMNMYWNRSYEKKVSLSQLLIMNCFSTSVRESFY